MYRIVKNISPETIRDIASRLSKGNKEEFALYMGKRAYQLKPKEYEDLLMKQANCEGYNISFLLYDHKNIPQAVGGANTENGRCWFVITENIKSATYILWLREAKELTRELQNACDSPLNCYSDSRNIASHRWYNFIGLRRYEQDDVYLYDGKEEVRLYFYEHSVPLAEPSA